MEPRRMSGCVRSPIHNIPAHYLDSSTDIFSEDFIHSLVNDLGVTMEQLARELGFSGPSVSDGLYGWCNNPGSTVFVLVSVLGNLGRADCVQKIEQYIQSNIMQIYLKVEEAATDGRPVTGSPQFYQKITHCEFSLLEVLKSALGEGLVYYDITGPGPWVTWTTSAKELKGQQLTLLHYSQPVPGTQAALCDQIEPDTELKQAVVTENIPATTGANLSEETLLKELACTQIEDLKYSHMPSIQNSNSNNLTLSDTFNKERASFGSLTAEGPSKIHSHPSLDSAGYTFTIDQQPQVKVLTVGEQNMPAYAQVIKHFPDKLLYKESGTRENNQDIMTEQSQPMEVLENLPCLSILERDSSSIATNTQRPTLHHLQEEKQNNLNCSAPLLVKHSRDYHTVPKTFHSEMEVSAANARLVQERPQGQTSRCSSVKTHDPVIQTSACSGTNMAEFQLCHASNSVHAQENHDQVINVSMFPACGVGLPLACIQSVDKQLQINSSALENEASSHCEHSGSMIASPKRRHMLGHVTQPYLIPAGLQQEYVQHTLPNVQILKLKPLQLQQQILESSQMTASGREIMCAIDEQNDQSSPQLKQYQYQFYQDTETQKQLYQHIQQQQVNSPDENSHCYQTQNLNHNVQDNENQTFLMETSQHQLHNQQSQYSQQETQPSPPLYLKSSASPFLICHTPPPGFPDEQMRGDIHNMSDIGEGQSPTFEKACPNLEVDPGNLYLGRLRQETNMDTSTDQYMTMFPPISNENPGLKSSSVKSHTSLRQFTTLQNPEFTYKGLTNPQTQSQFGRMFAPSSSGSVFIQDGPSIAFTESETVFLTSRPFNPAPPLINAPGRRNNISMTAYEAPRRDKCESSPSQEEYYNSANNIPRSKSLTSDSTQVTIVTPRQNLETDLLQLDGWCPHENGDTIQETMKKYRCQDGNYIIWKSRRMKQFIISVSHLNQLFHFRVKQFNSGSSGIVYYLFDGGYTSQSLLDLVLHYQEKDIRISLQSAGNRKTYIENIKLLYPLKVRMVKSKETTKSK